MKLVMDKSINLTGPSLLAVFITCYVMRIMLTLLLAVLVWPRVKEFNSKLFAIRNASTIQLHPIPSLLLLLATSFLQAKLSSVGSTSNLLQILQKNVHCFTRQICAWQTKLSAPYFGKYRCNMCQALLMQHPWQQYQCQAMHGKITITAEL